MAADTVRAFDAPARDRAERQGPLLKGAMALIRDVEVTLGQQPTAVIQHRRGQGPLVGIDSDDVAVEIPSLGQTRCFQSAPPFPRVEGTGRHLPVKHLEQRSY